MDQYSDTLGPNRSSDGQIWTTLSPDTEGHNSLILVYILK